MDTKLNGVFPVIPTLFDSDNKIDTEAQRAIVQFAVEKGAAALVCPAVASEYNFLSLEERAELVSLVVEEVDGRVPMIGGASGQSVEEVVAAGTNCLDSGIDMLMIMAPSSLGDDLDMQIDFMAQVSRQLPRAQILLQNAPSPIGAGLSAEAMVELVTSCEMIKFVKEETLPSGPAITAVQEAKIPHLIGVIGGGGSRYMIDELNRGVIGVMPAIEILDLHVAIYDAYTQGDQELARKLYRNSLPILVSQLIYRMRLTKYVLNQRGITNDVVVRAPLPEMDDYTKADIDVMVADLEESLA